MATETLTATDHIDTAQAHLEQARSVLAMLTAAGQGDTFECLTHSTVMGSLWALDALLGHAALAVKQFSLGGAEAQPA